MHNKYFEILPSNILRYWVIGIHAVVFVIILFFPLTLVMKLIFIGLVGISFFYNKNKKSLIKSFEFIQEDKWKVYTQQDCQYPVQLLKKNYISDFLVILRFELEKDPQNQLSFLPTASLLRCARNDAAGESDNRFCNKSKKAYPALLLFPTQLSPQNWRTLQMILRN